MLTKEIAYQKFINSLPEHQRYLDSISADENVIRCVWFPATRDGNYYLYANFGTERFEVFFIKTKERVKFDMAGPLSCAEIEQKLREILNELFLA